MKGTKKLIISLCFTENSLYPNTKKNKFALSDLTHLIENDLIDTSFLWKILPTQKMFTLFYNTKNYNFNKT